MRRLLPVLLLPALAASTACRQEARPTPPSPPAAVDASSAPLVLVGVQPPDGAQVIPSQVVQLTFDRPVDPASATPASVRLEYVDSRRRFLVDPFQSTAMTVLEGSGGKVLQLDPPELLPGETVRLTLTPALRAADGGALEAGPEGSRVVTWQVPDLPRE